MAEVPASMPCPVARHARNRPGAPAIVTEEETRSYAALDRAAARTADRLRRAGVEAGTRVALHLRRSPRSAALLVALWRLGAVAVPLSTRLPAAGVASHLDRAGAELLIAGDETPAGVADRATGRLRRRPAGDVIAALPSAPGAPGADAPDSPTDLPHIERDRPATIVFTSGSTGTPKGAVHTWGNHVYSARGSAANIPVGPGDRWLLSLPIYHVGGLAIIVRCLLDGAAVALPASGRPTARAVGRLQATHASLVATQLRRLLREGPGAPPDTVKALLCGGGAIPNGLLREARQRGWPVHTTYGCTEMGSQVTTTPPGASPEVLRSAGRVLPHRAVRIADDGQILVAGPTLFAGYIGDDGLEDPRRPDGWYPTGDVGHFDAAECLHVEGRLDRQFVSGGENVQPEEIESVLETVADVERAVVVAVDDDEYGRRPVAFVQVRATPSTPEFAPEPGGNAGGNAGGGTEGNAGGDAGHGLVDGRPQPLPERAAGCLAEEVRERLPGFKVPDAFYRLPRRATAETLKVDRDRLSAFAERARRES